MLKQRYSFRLCVLAGGLLLAGSQQARAQRGDQGEDRQPVAGWTPRWALGGELCHGRVAVMRRVRVDAVRESAEWKL
jgi:hypothetical protein